MKKLIFGLVVLGFVLPTIFLVGCRGSDPNAMTVGNIQGFWYVDYNNRLEIASNNWAYLEYCTDGEFRGNDYVVWRATWTINQENKLFFTFIGLDDLSNPYRWATGSLSNNGNTLTFHWGHGGPAPFPTTLTRSQPAAE